MKVSFFLGIFLFSIAGSSFAAVAAFPELPNLTSYLECRATTCTSDTLVSQAESDAESRGPGTYQYLLGNVATEDLELIQLTYTERYTCAYATRSFRYSSDLCRSGHWIQTFSLSYQTPPSDYIAQFVSYAALVGNGPIVIQVDPSKGPSGFTDQDSWVYDTSTYLRGLPLFAGNPFFIPSGLVATVVFSNGDTAEFKLIGDFFRDGPPAFAFAYVSGSAKDKNGHPLDDSALEGADNTSGSGSFPVGWSGASLNNSLLIVNAPIYYGWQSTSGEVIIRELCDKKGNCVLGK